MAEIQVQLEGSTEQVETFGLEDLLRVSVHLDPIPKRFIIRISDSSGNVRFNKYCKGAQKSQFVWRIPRVRNLGMRSSLNPILSSFLFLLQ